MITHLFFCFLSLFSFLFSYFLFCSPTLMFCLFLLYNIFMQWLFYLLRKSLQFSVIIIFVFLSDSLLVVWFFIFWWVFDVVFVCLLVVSFLPFFFFVEFVFVSFLYLTPCFVSFCSSSVFFSRGGFLGLVALLIVFYGCYLWFL